MDTKHTDSMVGLTRLHELIAGDAGGLSQKLQDHRLKLYPPKAEKTLRRFSSTETAKIIGVADSYLRKLTIEGKGPLSGDYGAGTAILLLRRHSCPTRIPRRIG